MARIGYARWSTREQNGDAQIDELKAAGCVRIFSDPGVSGKLAKRPEFDNCKEYLRAGDELVITRLSRAMRSISHMIELAEWLRERDVGLVVLKQDIDTRSATGRLLFHILAAIDEWQRELIVEGTMEGLAAARARGRKGGRKPKLTPEQVQMARQLYDAGRTVAEITRMLPVGRTTLYDYLKQDQPAVS